MKRVLMFLAIASFASADNKADEVLDRYFKAMGDVTHMETRHSQGSLETPGGRAGFQLWQKAPDRVAIELKLPRGTIRRGFDGTRGWEHSTLSGHRTMPATAQKAFIQQYSLNTSSPESIRRKFPKPELLTENQLRLTTGTNTTETWTFDASTHLLTRVDGDHDGGPQGAIAVTIFLEDYKNADSLMLPHTIRTKTKAAESTIHLDSIRHNVAMPDDIFQPPPQP